MVSNKIQLFICKLFQWDCLFIKWFRVKFEIKESDLTLKSIQYSEKIRSKIYTYKGVSNEIQEYILFMRNLERGL